jgi:NhaP-type Na+/H+ and K+/H+ antiporters with a unique C-terminal domain
MSAANKLFIGWFGPRGLASIVFAVIVFDAGLPGRSTLAVTTAFTVLLSVIAHGMTANPLVRRLGMSVQSRTPKAGPAERL